MLSHFIPDNSTLYLGILNSLRCWNYFSLPNNIRAFSNVGGFGIDGGLSTIVGASLNDRKRLYFGVVGDLGFFYDINILGNNNIGANLRILLINNGIGGEFKIDNHPGYMFGTETDRYIAASGHNGCKSKSLVKNIAENLGFDYLSASNKDDFDQVYGKFVTPQLTAKPIIFEVFIQIDDDDKAIQIINSIETKTISDKIKTIGKDVLGHKGIKIVKSLIQ